MLLKYIKILQSINTEQGELSPREYIDQYTKDGEEYWKRAKAFHHAHIKHNADLYYTKCAYSWQKVSAARLLENAQTLEEQVLAKQKIAEIACQERAEVSSYVPAADDETAALNVQVPVESRHSRPVQAAIDTYYSPTARKGLFTIICSYFGTLLAIDQ